ncbi:MAG TPA: NAD(P)/FAD-dependent oxidoreductase [Pirellulales bacterium]|jgi:monoamine oxidase|nr:NAD(P)/FAD-dependent oxidoreductase [Pirellulales bacterium]
MASSDQAARQQTDVVIVGAGAAGMAAAYDLAEAGRSVLVLEARPRIGGRILTLHDPAFGMPVELGAEFVHGSPPATWNLIRRAKLVAHDVPFQQWERRGKQLIHSNDASNELNKVMAGLARIGPHDMSFAQYLRKHCQGRGLAHARRMATTFVEGFDAADPERISAKSLAEEQEGLADLEHEKQFRLQAGYGSLMEHLYAGAKRKNVKVVLKRVVSDVKWKPGSVEISCVGHGRKTYCSRFAITTLPLGILQLPPKTNGAVRFSPNLPQKREAAMRIGFGPVVKLVLKFHEPFWEDRRLVRHQTLAGNLKDAVFFHDTQATFPTIWTMLPLRLPILTAWAGGPRANVLSDLSKAELVEAALDSVSHVFGLSKQKLTVLLDKVLTHNWPADPFSRGAYSYEMVNGSAARAQLAKPIENTLFFAGEATDNTGQASTVAGALASGQRAARQILACGD